MISRIRGSAIACPAERKRNNKPPLRDLFPLHTSSLEKSNTARRNRSISFSGILSRPFSLPSGPTPIHFMKSTLSLVVWLILTASVVAEEAKDAVPDPKKYEAEPAANPDNQLALCNADLAAQLQSDSPRAIGYWTQLCHLNPTEWKTQAKLIQALSAPGKRRNGTTVSPPSAAKAPHSQARPSSAGIASPTPMPTNGRSAPSASPGSSTPVPPATCSRLKPSSPARPPAPLTVAVSAPSVPKARALGPR